MPPKRKTAYDSQASANKRTRAEELSSGAFETEDAVRRSSRRGKGSGGQLKQMRNLERLQTAGAPRSKHLSVLDAATEGYEDNPMAPSRPSSTQAPSSKPRPKPRLKTNLGVSASGTPSAVQPSFSFAAPGGQFGFKVPEVDSSSLSGSGPTHEGSIFSTGSRPSTAPTSRANSVCPPSQGDHDAIQHAHGHSSHLKRLAYASQSGVEAPRRISRVADKPAYQSPAPPSQRSSQSKPQEDRKQSSRSNLPPQSREPAVPSRRSEGLDGTQSLHPRPTSLQRTASFYHISLDRQALCGHTLFATPNESEYRVGQNDDNLLIDETTPSEDDRFAESVLRGDTVFSRQQNQDRDYYQETHDDVSMEETLPDNDGHFAESPWGEDTYVHRRNEATDPSDIERPGQVASHSNDGPSNNYAEDDMLTRGRRTHGQDEVHDPSDTERDWGSMNGHARNHFDVGCSGQVALHRNDQGSTNSHAEDVVHTGQQQTRRQSEAHDLSTSEPSNHVSSNDQDRGSMNNQAEDIVLAHRRRNRAPHLPSSSQLASIRNQQYPQSQGTALPPASSQPSGTANQLEAQNATHPPQPLGTVNPVVAPVGPAAVGAEPWQMQFYRPVVQDILERAKQFSHCDAASVNAFPLRGQFNSLVVEYVEEAISERRSRGLPVSDGWWPHYTNEICRLLWEDLGNWRSALRKRARAYVTQRYKWDPENRRQVNSEIAKGLLRAHGAFLRDGVDEHGHTNNLAHPALASLIIDFFYTGASSLGKLFPEVFAAEAPRVTVAIAATALKVILDEMVSSQAEVNFRVNTYSPIYLEILGLMKKCDTSAIHAEKTKTLRIQWAHQGSNCSMESEAVTPASTGFDIALD